MSGLEECLERPLTAMDVHDPANSPPRSPASGSQRKPRVLLIAEAANPEWVSVPLVGWSHARAMAGLTDALLVTQVRNREAMLRAGLTEGQDADFVAIDTEHVAGPIHRAAELFRGGKGKGWTTVTALQSMVYYEFERQVWRRLGRRIRGGEFDLVHRITPLSPTTPSFTLPRQCRRAGVPFVLGPLNGGVPWPEGYGGVRRAEREWLSYLRDAYRLLPGYRVTRDAAAAILCGSGATLEQLGDKWRDKAFYMPENAIDPERFALHRTRSATPPLRIVFLGRLVPYKGADVLIEAAAPMIREGSATVEIIGDGPQMAELRELVTREGIEAGVTLAGWVEHARVQERLVGADVFGFPSVREFGGGVVLEAMAVGLAPVIADYAGPAELLTPDTGIAVPIAPREGLITGFREALAALVADPSRVDRLGEAARRRVLSRFTWDAKARDTLSLYRWLLDPSHHPRPDWSIPLKT